jgi:hypothetical protein
VEQVNLLLKRVPGTQLIDAREQFIEQDGSIHPAKMHDYLHLTMEGSLILQRLMIPVIERAFSKQ